MTEVTRSNYPSGPSPAVADEEPLRVSPVKVRELQRTLWAAAKQSQGRRFHALYDRIHRGEVLVEAWERVRKNKGAAGVDRVTLVAVEGYGVDRMLRELRRDLREGVHRPAPASRSFVLAALRALHLDPDSGPPPKAWTGMRPKQDETKPTDPLPGVPNTDKGDGETDPHCGHRAPDYQ